MPGQHRALMNMANRSNLSFTRRNGTHHCYGNQRSHLHSYAEAVGLVCKAACSNLLIESPQFSHQTEAAAASCSAGSHAKFKNWRGGEQIIWVPWIEGSVALSPFYQDWEISSEAQLPDPGCGRRSPQQRPCDTASSTLGP